MYFTGIKDKVPCRGKEELFGGTLRRRPTSRPTRPPGARTRGSGQRIQPRFASPRAGPDSTLAVAEQADGECRRQGQVERSLMRSSEQAEQVALTRMRLGLQEAHLRMRSRSCLNRVGKQVARSQTRLGEEQVTLTQMRSCIKPLTTRRP